MPGRNPARAYADAPLSPATPRAHALGGPLSISVYTLDADSLRGKTFRSPRFERTPLQLPSRAVLRFDERVGVGKAFGLHVLCVPLDPLARPEGDVAEQERLREHGRVAEVRERRRAALAGGDPFLVVARLAGGLGGAGEGGGWRLEVGELLAREQE